MIKKSRVTNVKQIWLILVRHEEFYILIHHFDSTNFYFLRFTKKACHIYCDWVFNVIECSQNWSQNNLLYAYSSLTAFRITSGRRCLFCFSVTYEKSERFLLLHYSMENLVLPPTRRSGWMSSSFYQRVVSKDVEGPSQFCFHIAQPFSFLCPLHIPLFAYDKIRRGSSLTKGTIKRLENIHEKSLL